MHYQLALLTALPLAAFAAINPKTSKGTFGPFQPAKAPLSSATGAPATVSAQQAKALQQACDNWTKDTGIVSNFQNLGKTTAAGTAFNSLANGAYVAEVDELTHKAILDGIIGNDPSVSIANLTLTNGVFQSVVDNLQIMSIQGKARVNLIDNINSVRCTQILPSIDQYCIVANNIINNSGQTGTLRKAVRPTACAAVLAADNNPNDYPNLPGLPGASATVPTPAAGGNTGATGGTTGGGRGGKGRGGNTGGNAAATSAAAPAASSAAATQGGGAKGGAKGGNPFSNLLGGLGGLGGAAGGGTPNIPGLSSLTSLFGNKVARPFQG